MHFPLKYLAAQLFVIFVDNKKCFLSILQSFLKDHVTLKTGVIVLKIQLCITGINCILKGSYDVAKKNIILCIWCNAMCFMVCLRLNTLFSTYVYYCCSSMLCRSETRKFLQSSSSEKRGVLWLASYPCVVIGRIPQACNRNFTSLPCLFHSKEKWNLKSHHMTPLK